MVKKNRREIHVNRATGQRFIGKSKDLVAAEFVMEREMNWAKGAAKSLKDAIVEDVWVIMHFHVTPEQWFVKGGANKGHERKTNPDLSNLYQLPEDCLQSSGIIDNDRLIKAHDWSRVVLSDKCALEIWIVAYDEFKRLEKETWLGS